MKILIAIGIAIVAFIIVTLFACLWVASREDQRMNQMNRKSQGE